MKEKDVFGRMKMEEREVFNVEQRMREGRTGRQKVNELNQ